jgi:hypothetical protein
MTWIIIYKSVKTYVGFSWDKTRCTLRMSRFGLILHSIDALSGILARGLLLEGQALDLNHQWVISSGQCGPNPRFEQ